MHSGGLVGHQKVSGEGSTLSLFTLSPCRLLGTFVALWLSCRPPTQGSSSIRYDSKRNLPKVDGMSRLTQVNSSQVLTRVIFSDSLNSQVNKYYSKSNVNLNDQTEQTAYCFSVDEKRLYLRLGRCCGIKQQRSVL